MSLMDSYVCPGCKAPARLVDRTDGPVRMRTYLVVTVQHMPWCKVQPGSELWNAAVKKLRDSLLTGRQRR